MARQIAVSFEDNVIRVVYADLTRGNLTVQKTLILKEEEFDGFLEREPFAHFTVVYNFKTFYQEILSLPKVAKKYTGSMIEAEIRKKAAELGSFSFASIPLGGKAFEGRNMEDFFVFAVNSDIITGIIERFTKYGKTIRYMYPSVFALSRMILTDNLLLCVAETTESKILFLSKNRRLYFVRSSQSFQSGIHDSDIQNISLTANYCRQMMKTMPSNIVLMGTACSNYSADIKLPAPASCIEYPANILETKNVIAEFVMPISALLPAKDAEEGNLLPRDYRAFHKQKRVLVYCIAVFSLLSLLGLVYMAAKVFDISSAGDRIKSLKTEIAGMEQISAAYKKRRNELQEFTSVAGFINSANSSPDFQKALIDLQYLRVKNAGMHSIQLKREGDVIKIQIDGRIEADNFSDMQRAYQTILENLKKNNMSLASDKLDLKDKGFHIEAEYK